MGQIEETSEQLSFYQLFKNKKYRIEIPIIQRDYAQGRKSAQEVRVGFVDALYSYLLSSKSFNDLDFIYGDVDENKTLIPLDGQQRLTTLFLLHWYFAIKEEEFYDDFIATFKDGKTSKFTYKTRQSSSDFCNALINNRVNLDFLLEADEGKENEFSKSIKDSTWFYLSWEKDPTVQSMLCMLDLLHQKLKNSESGLYKRLIDQENPSITFQFLPLSDYGLTNDLYIKMNSRGKPLTRFENFKAKFEKHLSTADIPEKYILNEDEVDVNTYFSHQIDTKWTDLFWNYKQKIVLSTDEDVIEYQIDHLIMNFIDTMAINHYAASSDKVKNLIDNQGKLSLNFYTSLNNIFAKNLIEGLDLLSGENGIKKYLVNNNYYNEEKSFVDILNKNFKDAAYLERIQFYAYYAYLIHNNGDNSGFINWIRVVVNLSRNTMPYNTETEFINSIRGINEIIKFSKNILENLRASDSIKIQGFNPYQIKEERIKAHLFNKNEWKELLLKAEQHGYFKGQLTFALAFSGIEDYFDQNGNCDWNSDQDQIFLKTFNNYIQKTFALFADTGLKEEAKINFKLHRAILSKGDYLIYAKSNWSFLNDSDRDVSWKRYLLGDGEDRKKKREFFKEVIDDALFTTDDLGSLNRISLNYNSSIDSWRKKFIDFPRVFESMGGFLYVRPDEDKWFLLTGIKISSEHSELNSLVLFLNLFKTDFFKEPAPFCKLDYYPVTGYTTEPCIYFDEWIFGDHNFAIDIYYLNGNNFRINFFDRNKKEISGSVINILKIHGFNDDCEIILEESKIESFIIKLCEQLNTL